jgi:hypothetical protein
MTEQCGQYCSHGGFCDLDAGHEGLHQAGVFCSWSSVDSLTKEEADEVLAEKEGGPEYLAARGDGEEW